MVTFSSQNPRRFFMQVIILETKAKFVVEDLQCANRHSIQLCWNTIQNITIMPRCTGSFLIGKLNTKLATANFYETIPVDIDVVRKSLQLDRWVGYCETSYENISAVWSRTQGLFTE